MSVLARTDFFRELEEGYGGDVYGKRYLPDFRYWRVIEAVTH
jgi:hypothetical protein